MSTYKIIEPSGRITFILAKTRTESIDKFLDQTGMPRDFFKKHCAIHRASWEDVTE